MRMINAFLFGIVVLFLISPAGAVNATYSSYDGGYRFTRMTKPETTQVISCRENVQHVFQFLVANINTNIVVRMEGSLDGNYFFNLDINNVSLTVTANGAYGFKSTARIKFIRLVWVSESGGTAATLDAHYYGGAQ